jgi:hypothetical protein
MTHDYNPTCQCYRCKGIRNNPFPSRVVAMQTKAKRRNPRQKVATREEQHARYLDCGPANWDDR